MTISDWDALVVDEDGRSMNGVSELSALGVQVELYESFLNILDSKAWRAGGLYPSPVVTTLHNGEMTYLDWYIVCAHGVRDGIVFAAWFLTQNNLPKGMVGISVNGFDKEGKWTGVTLDDVKSMDKQLKKWRRSATVPAQLTNLPLDNALRFNMGDRFFAKNLNIMLPATPPGQAELPMKYVAERGTTKEQ